MKRLCVILLLTILSPACARLPEIRDVQPAAAQRTAAECAAIFPKGVWQFAHAIQFFPPDGSSKTLVGIVRLSSEAKRFDCVMMTIEGLVLFEAEYDGRIKIKRAIAPLDKPGVAEGMVEDIRLIFFAPEPWGVETGFTPEGESICRYPLPDGGREEILPGGDGAWEIRRYAPNHRLLRSVAPLAGDKVPLAGIPARVELKAPGLAGYRLVMRLVEAIPIEQESKP
ncbi:MAG: hypothetical protein HY911_16185 [Desulfobacterales bacterium]|nr:hypothetical protein [Desulfobacterales bacterium]